MANILSRQTFTVLPTNKHNLPQPPPIALHALDLLMPPFYIRFHLFFGSDTTRGEVDTVERLRTSLAQALELFPPVAGSIRQNENGELTIVSDGAGAEFQVETKSTPFVGDGDELAPRPTILLTPASMLAVKLTQFSCGTVAVAVCIHHYATDLQGYIEFISVWAKLAQGEHIDLQSTPKDWAHTPNRFFIDHEPPSAPSSFPGLHALPSPTPPGPPPMPPAAERVRWRIEDSAVQRLKADFEPVKGSGAWISSGDALAALLWGAVTRAREQASVPRVGPGRTSEEERTETLAMAADGRDRSPGKKMTGGQYFGNFNTIASITVPRNDLLDPEAESSSRVALAIRNALKDQLSPSHIASKIAFLESPENQPTSRVIVRNDFMLTNWSKFDFVNLPEMDFGWGKPIQVTSGAVQLPPGMIQIYRLGRELMVLTVVEAEAAEFLKADRLMKEYAVLDS